MRAFNRIQLLPPKLGSVRGYPVLCRLLAPTREKSPALFLLDSPRLGCPNACKHYVFDALIDYIAVSQAVTGATLRPLATVSVLRALPLHKTNKSEPVADWREFGFITVWRRARESKNLFPRCLQSLQDHSKTFISCGFLPGRAV